MKWTGGRSTAADSARSDYPHLRAHAGIGLTLKAASARGCGNQDYAGLSAWNRHRTESGAQRSVEVLIVGPEHDGARAAPINRVGGVHRLAVDTVEVPK